MSPFLLANRFPSCKRQIEILMRKIIAYYNFNFDSLIKTDIIKKRNLLEILLMSE